MQLGTEKIEALAESIKKIAIAGKKISADKKVDVADLSHVIGLIPELPSIIDSFKEIGAAFEEGKDLDVAEVVKLIQAIHAKVKEIENS